MIMEYCKESTICYLHVGQGLQTSSFHSLKEIDPLLLKVRPLSTEETEYAGIWETHRASFLQNREEVGKWTSALPAQLHLPATTYPMMPLPPPMTDSANSRKLGEVILKRASTRS